MSAKKCITCGTSMQEIDTAIRAGWGKYKLTIEGVKAYRCPKCGEEVFTAKEAIMIQELGKNLYQADPSSRPELLNVSETAKLLRVSNQSIYNMIRDGRLKAVKTGREWRFRREDLDRITRIDKPSHN